MYFKEHVEIIQCYMNELFVTEDVNQDESSYIYLKIFLI